MFYGCFSANCHGWWVGIGPGVWGRSPQGARRNAVGRVNTQNSPGTSSYVSHSNTVRHREHLARTRPRTGTLIR